MSEAGVSTSQTMDEPTPERGFAVGEHVVLRPVLEEDLPELAKLLAANPGDDKPLPWTLQRLKKKFEDKDEPGLWGKDDRYFAVVRRTGGLVGFLREQCEASNGTYWDRLYVSEQVPDRNSLGRDAVAAYLTYKQRWHNPRRISFDLLKCEQEPAEWLVAGGFEFEIAFPRWTLYRGQPEALCIYSWLSEECMRDRAGDGLVAGEEVE